MMTIPVLLLGLLLQSTPLGALSGGTNGFITFTNGPVYYDSSIYSPSSDFIVFGENGTNVVTIAKDGKVTLATKPEAAAAVFWNAVQQLGHQSSALQSNREEVLEVLKGCHDCLKPFGEYVTITPAVYIPPAARLRAEADAIEKREAFMKRLESLIEKLK